VKISVATTFATTKRNLSCNFTCKNKKNSVQTILTTEKSSVPTKESRWQSHTTKKISIAALLVTIIK
jgi:hypothetical protein